MVIVTLHTQPERNSVSLLTEGEETGANRLFDLTQRKLRWGAVALPRHLAESIAQEDGKVVLHLGFGGEEHNIGEPEDGQYYA